MATAKQTFGTPSPRPMTAMDDEGKAVALRQACWVYDARRRDIETKFETELSTLREQYLSEVLNIHSAKRRTALTCLHGARLSRVILRRCV
jgi:hypothetical protein